MLKHASNISAQNVGIWDIQNKWQKHELRRNWTNKTTHNSALARLICAMRTKHLSLLFLTSKLVNIVCASNSNGSNPGTSSQAACDSMVKGAHSCFHCKPAGKRCSRLGSSQRTRFPANLMVKTDAHMGIKPTAFRKKLNGQINCHRQFTMMKTWIAPEMNRQHHSQFSSCTADLRHENRTSVTKLYSDSGHWKKCDLLNTPCPTWVQTGAAHWPQFPPHQGASDEPSEEQADWRWQELNSLHGSMHCMGVWCELCAAALLAWTTK